MAPDFLPELRGLRFLKVSLTYQDGWKRPQPFLCHCLALQDLLILSTAGSHFSSFPFASLICRSPSCCLPCHGRFNPVTPLSDRVFVLLLGHLALIPSLVCFLFNSEFCPELLVQLCGLPVLFVWFPALGRRPFFNFKEEDPWKSTSSSGTYNIYDCVLWDSSKQTPEHEKSEHQGCGPIFWLCSFLEGSWTPHSHGHWKKDWSQISQPDQFLLPG